MSWLRWFACPLIFLAVHTALVVLVWIGVRTSHDTVAKMAWIQFEFIDWPASIPLFPRQMMVSGSYWES
jgi:hypothetical protein